VEYVPGTTGKVGRSRAPIAELATVPPLTLCPSGGYTVIIGQSIKRSQQLAKIREPGLVAESAQIYEDLAGAIRRWLLFYEVSRRLYSTDASIFQVQPLGIVVPADEEDLQAIVRYAVEHKLSITARGAGSGMAGESLGAGLIVDFTKSFRRIIRIGPESVEVQPGVVYRHLQEALAKTGRRLAPDPASGTQ